MQTDRIKYLYDKMVQYNNDYTLYVSTKTAKVRAHINNLQY